MMRKATHLGVMASAGIGDAPGREASVILEPLPTQIPIFDSFMLMGLIPPFSDLEVLHAYGLQLLHLTPGVVLQLALFAYACEAFVGVMSSMALFCHFFHPASIRMDGWGRSHIMLPPDDQIGLPSHAD